MWSVAYGGLTRNTFDKLFGFAERLRSAVLKAGAIDVLRGMIGPENYQSTYAGLHYLRVIARFGWLTLFVSVNLPLTPLQMRTEAHFQIARR